MGDKEIKAEFRKKASNDPDKYYATGVLKEEGFHREKCDNCSRCYWTVTNSTVCGDPACSGGFRFVGKSPAKEKLDYIEVWKRFSNHFKKAGYTPIDRYPVAARWRKEDFVQASIYDFQPYVVSGEVEPPANPLVVPQFCLRFNDIDNVGLTGAHYTGFVMIGQHAFMPEKDWDQKKYFKDIHSWLRKGLGLPNEEITYHEDAWAGGGNFGPCMEYFSRGLELGNQVYMLYETGSGVPKPLPLRVLDMGMGQERNAWFTGAAPTSYETTFPSVVKMLQKITGVSVEKDLLSKFLPFSSYLNADEVDDIEKVWKDIGQKTGIGSDLLKKEILPLSAMYSIAEHARSLLVAISDGVLPSNVAGGYNLRVILRRALGFADKYGWEIDLAKICEEHARYLKPQFPELKENLNEVAEVLEVEKRKYLETRKRAKQMVARLVESKKKIDTKTLIELYDSQGINPAQIQQESIQDIKIPDNFYAMVAQRHEKKEQISATKKKESLNVDAIATRARYYDDYSRIEFTSNVQKIIGNKVILDETYFFPTSGGQVHDTGILCGIPVVDVIRDGKHIVHVLQKEPKFKEGENVEGKIDFERRKQLSQHHTITHVFNQLMRRQLGAHAWQAGTAKFVDKARLDMTHYDALTPDQLTKLEEAANKIIQKGLAVKSRFEPRSAAEQKYGFGIYQGPVVPGKELRIVEIDGFDVEACGGTHVNNTKEIGAVRITKSSKIQDGVVRIEYCAGMAMNQTVQAVSTITNELAKILNCKTSQIPGRVEELFSKWKLAKKGKLNDSKLTSVVEFEGDIIKRVSEILRTQPEHLTKTTKRFLDEMENN